MICDFLPLSNMALLNESLTALSLITVQGVTFSNFGAAGARMQEDYTQAELLRNHSLSEQRTLD